jgi:hypothetical protein
VLEQIRPQRSSETEREMRSKEMRTTMRGFAYITLDPSPRLRKMRENQQQAAKSPAQIVGEAWLSVGDAIRRSLENARSRNTFPQ